MRAGYAKPEINLPWPKYPGCNFESHKNVTRSITRLWGKGGSVIPWWAIFLPWNFRESVNWRNFFRETVIQKSSAIRETQKYFPWKRDSVKFLPWIRDSDIFRDSWNAKKLFHGKTPFELIVYQLKKTQILKRVRGKYEEDMKRNARIGKHRHTTHPRRFLAWLPDLFNRSAGAIKSIMKKTILP